MFVAGKRSVLARTTFWRGTAVVQRAMRHSSPETKRRYQLGIVHQVREHVERANEKAYEGHTALHFRDSDPQKEPKQTVGVSN
jgi:hypothetical protein